MSNCPSITPIALEAFVKTEIDQTLLIFLDKFYDQLKPFARLATPICKGEITAGKMKWRGVKLIENQSNGNLTIWLEQRGERISPRFTTLMPHLNAYKQWH